MVSPSPITQHDANHILYAPQELQSMEDIKLLLSSGQSAIFYKDLRQDLLNIEFHISTPCIIYLTAGKETITSCDNQIHDIQKNEAIFLPKGLTLHSDYKNANGPLTAYLLFFGDDVITEFLSTDINTKKPETTGSTIHKININSAVKHYFSYLHSAYQCFQKSPQLSRIKLLELLFLIDIDDSNHHLRLSLSTERQGKTKRNIQRLMEKYIISNLSSKDFAALSGRSISSFNREFKQLYKTTPKQWLIEKRLSHAYMLLTEKQWTVTATAAEVGYDNISHFISAFKRRYQKTPNQIKSKI